MGKLESNVLLPETDQPLTTYEISRYLHVDLTTVISWCDLGKIKAYKTPGGHRRVQQRDFLQFIHQYGMPVPPEFHAKTGKVKVLIVDDEESIRKVVRRAVARSLPQAEIYEAQDGFEAGKWVLDARPDLVVLDLKLPGVDGFRICANIKGDERLRATRILAITGQDTEENRERILKEGADDFLPKPFDVKDLVQKVTSLLEAKEAV